MNRRKDLYLSRPRFDVAALRRSGLFLGALFMLSGVSQVFGDDCVNLGGTMVGVECQIKTAQAKSNANCAVPSAGCQVNESLHFLPGGVLTVSPAGAALTINVTGDLTMDIGSGISGNVLASDTGAQVILNATGNILLHGNGSTGALVSANNFGCAGAGGMGGSIVMTADSEFPDGDLKGNVTIESGARVTVSTARCPAGSVEINGVNIDNAGTVESASTLSSGGLAAQPPGGGPISLNASCELVVNNTGKVSSSSRSPGGDLVHLEGGCSVKVYGLVESTGPGNVVPNSPPNHCGNNAGKGGGGRPDKPANSTACVEIWAGDSLVIDSKAPHNGQINTDTAQAAGFQRSWVDIFARGPITITGDSAAPYAVHANESVTNAIGGGVTIKSTAGTVSMTGLAVQANATAGGGRGGEVTVEGSGDVALNTAAIEARGASTGNGQAGGKIHIRSFTGRISGAAPGKVDAFGGKPANGQAKFTASFVTPATTYTGNVIGSRTNVIDQSGSTPLLPLEVISADGRSYVALKPCLCLGARLTVSQDCACGSPTNQPPFTVTLTGKVCNKGTENLHNVALSDNLPTTFTQPAALPTPTLTAGACFPYTGALNDPMLVTGSSANTVTATAVPATGGIVSDQAYASCECRLPPPPPPAFCKYSAIISLLDPSTGRFPGNKGLDTIVRVHKGQSIQAALDLAAAGGGDTNNDAYILIGVIATDTGDWGGSTSQSVSIEAQYNLPFALLGCGVTLKDPTPNDSNPTGRIRETAGSPTNIFITNLHAADSNVAGWVVEGDGRELRTVNASNNALGIDLKGNNNTIKSGTISKNRGVGILIEGSTNLISDAKSNQNSSDGIRVVSNGNTLRKNEVAVSGSGNSGDGIKVSGNNNLLEENQVNSNVIHGIEVTGTQNALKKNVTTNNGGKEFLIGPNNADLGGNKFNGVACGGFDTVGGTCN
jgi:hypothetical protein